MGVLIKAECNCGFKKEEMAFGMGMKRIIAPAVCLNCKNIIELDYVLKYAYKCKKCKNDVVFYNNQHLQDWNGKNKKQVKIIDYFNIDFIDNSFKWAAKDQQLILSDEEADEAFRKIRKESSINKKFTLYEINYLCPVCLKFTLKFTKIFGFWD
ncbi:MAG TPA: hypothetical protein PK771_00620 [Spirochaetota bacterium]|nr:hypothetical protein [Spirochaetota bacterium]